MPPARSHPLPRRRPQSPGYLGFGFTYHKPDPAQTRDGWLMVRHVPDDGPAYRAGLGDAMRLTIGGHDPRALTIVAAEMPPDKLGIWRANFEPRL